MTNHQYVQVERTLLKRGLTDFERKLKAAAASGALGYAVVVVLAAFGVRLPASVAELIPLGVALLGGWATHSSAVTTTFSGGTDAGYSVRVGPSGTPVGEPKALTGAIPLPVASTPEPAPQPAPSPVLPPAADPVPYEVPDVTEQPAESFTSVVDGEPFTAPDGATQVLPSSAGAQAWAQRYLRTSN